MGRRPCGASRGEVVTQVSIHDNPVQETLLEQGQFRKIGTFAPGRNPADFIPL
jgi:hypothetical protein